MMAATQPIHTGQIRGIIDIPQNTIYVRIRTGLSDVRLEEEDRKKTNRFLIVLGGDWWRCLLFSTSLWPRVRRGWRRSESRRPGRNVSPLRSISPLPTPVPSALDWALLGWWLTPPRSKIRSSPGPSIVLIFFNVANVLNFNGLLMLWSVCYGLWFVVLVYWWMMVVSVGLK